MTHIVRATLAIKLRTAINTHMCQSLSSWIFCSIHTATWQQWIKWLQTEKTRNEKDNKHNSTLHAIPIVTTIARNVQDLFTTLNTGGIHEYILRYAYICRAHTLGISSKNLTWAGCVYVIRFNNNNNIFWKRGFRCINVNTLHTA